MKAIGKVSLIGAGPGDIELMTAKGLKELSKADVVVYDALLSPEAIALAPKGAEMIYVGKRANNHAMPQEGINQLLLEKALEGKNVARLKGGDPFLFGRGGEELELLKAHSVPYTVVPGIPSPIAAASYAGIPITHRDFASSLHIVTARSKDSEASIDFKSLNSMGGTIVFMMGASSVGFLAESLIKVGMRPDMPAAIVSEATTARQQSLITDLKDVAEGKAVAKAPAVFIVGEVCSLAGRFSWREGLMLSGLRVAIAMGGGKAGEWASKLRDLGCEACDFEPITQEAVPGCESYFSGIGGYNWVALASPRACDAFFGCLEKLNIDIRSVNASFAVVGESTAEALKARSVIPSLIASPQTGKALGAAIAREAKPGDKILLCRSLIGGEDIINVLNASGIEFTDAAIYTSVFAGPSQAAERAVASGCDYYMFSSASAVKGFAHMAQRESFEGMKAVCIGENCAKAAIGLGFEAYWPEKASIEAMAELLIELKQREGGINAADNQA